MGSLLSLLVGWSFTKPIVHVSPSALSVETTSSKVPLKEFLESKCPSILAPFKPAWWLFNGHLQTAYCVLGDFSNVDKVVYERQLLALPDGGTIGLDFTGPTTQEKIDPGTTIVVVMHGLTGGSYESYVRSILSVICAARERGGSGYRGVVVNFRGCAGVELTSAQMYSAGYTDDLRTALFYLSMKYPRARFVGLGFSLGANVITRYLGEEGTNSKLISGCVLGCPWDLRKLSINLFRRNIYSRAMGKNLQRLSLLHLDTFIKKSTVKCRPDIDGLLKAKNPRLMDLDDMMIRFVGGSSPPFPFPSPAAYHKWASSHNHIRTIRVPFLAINALDDPIVSHIPIPIPEEARHTIIVTTPGGGHLGWFQRQEHGGFLHVERWSKAPVCEWLRATGDELVAEPRKKDLVEKVDGFTRLVDTPKIGYREKGTFKVVADAGAAGVLAGL
ncbi:AB-hydrolase YheT [Hysterangium stoloniferum]|nr:AB-hydrolase YheT [Hysterangium stoloniferum]